VTLGRRAFLCSLAALAAVAHAQGRNSYLARTDVQQFVDELVTTHGFERP
jgi:hypothetical protein